MRRHQRGRRRLAQLAGAGAVILVFAVTIWLDVATGLWQQAVILSGIAAGLLTFLLTSLFFERWLARADHRRWYPVTHLALTDLLHALADEERSHFGRGIIVARTLPVHAAPEAMLARIVEDRRTMSHALARWAGFLSASADVQTLMDHVAALALLLDSARDAVLESEAEPADPATDRALRAALAAVDTGVATAVAEIESTLAAFRAREQSEGAPAARSG